MNLTPMAATNSWILKPFAFVLSFIFNGLFSVISQWTVHQSLAITIILFTFIVRALMMPLMLKQQRSTRRMARLQPKIEQIQAKYKNKKDPETTQRMNAEIQKLYSENKANPMSGCLPLLIQMPILFALFEILRNVPFYVTQIGDLYTNMATTIQGISGASAVLTGDAYASVANTVKLDMANTTTVMDFLYRLTGTQWGEIISALGLASNKSFMADYELQAAYSTFGFGALTFNLSENPGWRGWGIIFPIVSGVTTFLQSFLAQRASEKRQKMANPDGTVTNQQQSMKMMTYVFPFMTAFFTASMPLGLGLYWIAGNVFGIVSTWISDSIIDREEYQEAVKRRDEMIAKRKEKEAYKSSIDKATGGRIGSFGSNQTKSSLAGNKMADAHRAKAEETATAAKELASLPEPDDSEIAEIAGESVNESTAPQEEIE